MTELLNVLAFVISVLGWVAILWAGFSIVFYLPLCNYE